MGLDRARTCAKYMHEINYGHFGWGFGVKPSERTDNLFGNSPLHVLLIYLFVN